MLKEESAWLIESVDNRFIHFLKCNPLIGRSCIEVPEELDYLRTGLIDICNMDDNEGFRWCLIRHLKPIYKNPPILVFVRENKNVYTIFITKTGLKNVFYLHQ